MDTPFMRAENATHKLEVFYDSDAESPREFIREAGNTSRFVTWLNHFQSPDENTYYDQDEYLDWWFGPENDATAGVILPVYESGYGHRYSTGDALTARPEMASDAGVDGFISSTAKQIKEWGVPIEKVAEYLAGEVAAYSKWANGEYWGYVLSEKIHHWIEDTYKGPSSGGQKRYETDGWEETDSCWGFDYDDPKQGLRDNLSDFDALIEELA